MFLLPDTLGSPQVATWAGGTLLWKESYRPYGDRLINNQYATDINSIFYAGKQFNEYSHLSYMGGRYYRPEIGRFTGVDPREVDADNPHTFNRYAYAANSPYRYVDPDGNTPIDIAFLAYDIGKLGVAMYTGVGVPGALADVGLSVAGVFSPVPGGRFALQALKYSERGAEMTYTAVRGAEAASSVAKAAETAAKGAGIVAKDGTAITGLTKHGVDRVIGDGAKRGGTKPDAILDAVKNPAKIREGVDTLGRPFKVYSGESARVVINPKTGKIISTNPLSREGSHLP